MQPDLRAAHVVLEHLLDDVDVAPPPLQARQRLVDVGARALDDEGAEAAEDMLEVGRAPDLGLAHGLDEVRPGEERDARLQARGTVGREDAAAGERAVDLGLEVVEHLGRRDVVGLQGGLSVRGADSACEGGGGPTLMAS